MFTIRAARCERRRRIRNIAWLLAIAALFLLVASMPSHGG